jgi:tyrosyl-tRNA synthetase
MYGKLMSLKDDLIIDYFKLCTDSPLTEILKIEKGLKRKEINPKEAKMRLAKEIVRIYHGEKEALEAEREFEMVFKEKKLPKKIPEIKIKEKILGILDLLVKTKLVSSKSEAKRLILAKAVKINGFLKEDWREKIKIEEGMVIKVGKRKFLKINPPL